MALISVICVVSLHVMHFTKIRHLECLVFVQGGAELHYHCWDVKSTLKQ